MNIHWMQELMESATADANALFSKLLKLALFTVFGWLLLNAVLYYFFDVVIQRFNVLRLQMIGIRYKRLFKIRSVSYNLRKHRIFIDGFEWIGEAAPAREGDGGEREQNSASSGQGMASDWRGKRGVKWLPRLARVLNSFGIVLENTKVGHFTMHFILLEIKSDGSNFHLEIYQQGLNLKDQCMLSNVVFRAESVIDVSAPFPFTKIHLEVKLRDLFVPLNKLLAAVKRFRSKTRDDEKMSGDVQEECVEPEALAEEEWDMEETMEVVNCKFAAFHRISSIFEKIDIFFDSPVISGIPLRANAPVIEKAQGIQLKVSTTSFVFSLSRSTYSDPGTKLLFDCDDKPLKLSTIIAALQLSVINTNDPSLKLNEIKICEVPNISLNGDTNFFSQKLTPNDSTVFADSVLKLVGHITSPTVDIDIEQLSLLKSVQRNLSVIQYIMSEEPLKKNKSLEEILDNLKQKGNILKYFQNILPHTELKITIEDPIILVSNEKDTLIQKFSIVSFKIKSNRLYKKAERKLFYSLDSQMEVLEWSFYHQNKAKNIRQPIVSVDNILLRLNSRLLPSLVLSAAIEINSLHVDLTNLETMIVINNTIKKRDIKLIYVEETYFKDAYTELELKLREKIEAFRKCQICSPSTACTDLIFKDLPPFFQYLRVGVNDFSAILGSRSVFIERKDYMDHSFSTSHDFISGDMRRISYSFEEIKLLFARANDSQTGDLSSTNESSKFSFDSFASDDKGLENASYEDLAKGSHRWSLDVELEEFLVELYSETKLDNFQLVPKPVWKAPSIKFFISPDNGKTKMKTSIQISRIDALFSLMTCFLFVSSIYNLKMIFTTDLYRNTKDCIMMKHIKTIKSLRSNCLIAVDFELLARLIEVDCTIDSFSCIMLLPNGVRTKFEFIDSSFCFIGPSSIFLRGHYARLMVESPLVRNTWMRMINIVQFRVVVDTDFFKSDSDEFAVILENDSWQWTIPHRFEMFKLFDNISTTFKSIKQMIHSLKSESNKSVIYPKVTKAVKIPKIKVKSKRCIFSVEDDPFESELNSLLQIGLKEQKERVEKYSLFRKHAEAEFKKSDVKYLKKSASFDTASSSNVRTRLREKSRTSLHMVELTDFDLERSDILLNQLKREYSVLNENISKSWITRVKKHRHVLNDHFILNFEFLWGTVDPTKLPKDFNKNVLDFRSSPALMNLILEDIDIDLREPSFGIDKIPEFIHDVGKKVPKETKYSIMIPLNLDAKFSEIRCHLKDYPLPAIHLPRRLKDNKEPSIRITCDLMITEDMICSEKELRTIYVPLVPSAHLEDAKTFYSLLVPRTLTAIKLYTDIQFDIKSDQSSRVVWGGSYSGAIQQIMKCFDNFSKPPIDPSPAVGFWDKIRNIFHARVSISLPDSSFEVALKGDKNPYKIGGTSAGYILLFKDNVTIHCNENDDPKRFLTVTASKLYFSVPNFFAKPLPVWNMPSELSLFFPDQEFSNLQENAAFYYLVDVSNKQRKPKDLEIMSEAYVEKTAIKLDGGMEFNVGIIFERTNQESQRRTVELEPHYKMRLCNPIYVSDLKSHDSYAGFRSKFIHLSFELIAKQKDAYNSLVLTPSTLKIFFKWWSTFSGNLPVRKGVLFNDEATSPKFGTHLYTISYRADVYPLFIGHIIPGMDSECLIDPAKSIEAYGLKAKTSEFSMDLHQRKEIFHEYKEKLNITKRRASLKFHEADVTTKDIDIRTLYGSFKRPGYGSKDSESIDIFDDDKSWYDVEDFSDFNFPTMASFIPKVEIKPLLFAALFAYKKIAPYGDKYQVDYETFRPIVPFKNADYHDCKLRKYVDIPDRLINNRYDIFMREKKNLETTIKLNNNRNSIFNEQLEIINRTLDQIHLLKKDINFLNAEYERADEEHDIARTNSRHMTFPVLNFMKSSHNSNKNYANKFIVISMLLKWNEEVRDVLLKYLHRVSLVSDMSNVTKLKTLQTIESLMEKSRKSISTINEESEDKCNHPGKDKDQIFKSIFHEDKDSDEILLSFQNDIKKLAGDFEYKIFEKHHVQLIAPQIQLTTVTDPEACVLVVAPTIKMNSLCFDSNTTDNEYQTNLFMRRTGVLLINSNIFVFHKEDQGSKQSLLFDNFLYGSTHDSSWRPWLGLELCFEPENLRDNMLISNFTCVFTHDQVLPFSDIPESLKSSKVLNNRISCDFPRIVIESNSARYLSLFNLVTHLLLYVEPESAKMKNDIAKMILGFNFEDLSSVKNVISIFEKEIDVLNVLENEYAYRKYLLDDAELSDLRTIRYAKFDTVMKMNMMMKVLTSASPVDANDEEMLLIVMQAKEIILHMLDDNRHNFLDVAVADLTFQRMETSAGYNFNKLTVGVGQVINLLNEALFHDLLSPINRNIDTDSKPFIELQWEKDKAVGGIQVVKNVVTHLEDLKVNVEQNTIEKIIAWISPDSVSSLIGNSQDDSDDDSSNESERRDSISSSQLSSFAITEDSSRQSSRKLNHSPTDAIFPMEDIIGNDEEMEEMVKRSSENMIIENIKINAFLMRISYQGKGAKRLINVTDFNLNFPAIRFSNQTMTIIDLMMHLKKIMIKSLLRHTGKFISNKLKRHTSLKRLKGATQSPLRQLDYYRHYTSVDELQQTSEKSSASEKERAS